MSQLPIYKHFLVVKNLKPNLKFFFIELPPAQSKKVDICLSVTINPERTSVVDFPIPVRREAITLMSAIPRGNTMNMWGYVRVFGVDQWAIFLALLMTLGLGLYAAASTNALREKTERSSLKYALSDFSTTLLFVLQMGEHTSVDKLAIRLLSMTMAMLTLLMFLYYNCDITAEMTSGPPGIPVKNFEDVLFYGYKVTTYSPNYKRQLSTEAPGTAKHRVYEKYLKEKELKNSVESVNAALMETLEDPKALLYGAEGIISPYSRSDKALRAQFQTLKTTDASWITLTLALQKESEFLQAFNYYLLKQFEHGLIKRNYRHWYPAFFTNEQFGMSEPYPLTANNVMFLFLLLAVGIPVSIAIAIMEFALHKFRAHCHSGSRGGRLKSKVVGFRTRRFTL